MRNIRLLIIIIFACLAPLTVTGQFYNGHQMTFGKNRIQHYDYYWSFYRFENIDCYFNEYGRHLAQYTADYAIRKLNETEDFFDYNLEKRLVFIINKSNNEYRESNVGLVTGDEDSYNTGGFSRIIKNKVLLYYEGDHVAYQKQIGASITEVIVNEMLYDADMRDRISSSSVITIPDWYIKGLANYVSFGWDVETENRVKDGIMTGYYKNINHLEYDDAVYAGQSFWRFIGKEYGDALIPNIIYLTKVYKNIEDGLLYVIGKNVKELMKEWKEFYRNEFADDGAQPDYDENVIARSKKEQLFQQVKISPDARYIAFVTNTWGRKKIRIYDQTTGKQKVIFRKEPKYEHITDNTYPVIAWHPGGKILTYINEENAGMVIYFYRTEEKKTEKRNLLYFDKILDFSYSPEGSRLILSGVKDGITDLYLHTISSGTNEQITRDIADDLHPSFLDDGEDMIIFSSNRLSDTLTNTADPWEKVGNTFNLFTYDLSQRNNVLTRLTEGQYTERFSPSGNIRKKFTYIGDADGIMNRYAATYDSAISYIDTATHYRYFIRSEALSAYDRNILSQSVDKAVDDYGEMLFNKGKYMIRKGKLSDSGPLPDHERKFSNFRQEKSALLHRADSIEQLRQWLIAEDKKRRDTLTKPLYEYYMTNEPIDINHYIFEKEKQNYFEQLWRKDYMDVDLDTGRLKLPLIRIYQTAFYNNYIANQIDFSFLNNTYQVYSGGAPYYNPGINLLTRFGVIDLFENYRITGGFRFSGNFDSNEYLVSAESLKGKLDKQFIFHRQGFFSSNDTSYFKSHTHNIYLTFSKPFTPVLSLKGTVAYRNDRHVMLYSDNMVAVLNNDIISRHWGNLKGELVYDNTRKRNINIYYGTRFKIFGEYYKELNYKMSDMIVIGVDFRKYTRIHRELIWANRFAASTSYGPTRLVYYLGGVDNWMGNIFNRNAMFDQSIPVNPNMNYGFQALATNMRGFIQNIRNGTSFALVNSEIRWPVIRYFAGHPLKSNFLNSFQLVGFGDIGSAWVGRSPWSGENAWDNEVIQSGSVKVVLDSNREPVVAGFGAGLRAQLLGYFVRADWAWGIENNYILPRVFYLSFSLDF